MLIDGVKFSCESCTRGHRQNSCKHVDRPLHEVPKRGRPPTACAECRELRKTTNSHRTCNHRKDVDDQPEVLLKSLPNGAGDLQSVELVRRPSSSVKSRSSTSAASVASTSAASASEDDLASVGRRKSVSRTSSLSRPSSAAREKKPHDLAHGHLADHPTHVSNAYSPYPHHHPHHHNHHMHVPSPLARSDGGSSGQRTGSNNSPAAGCVPPMPPLPPQLSEQAFRQQQQPTRPAQTPGASAPVVPKLEPLSNEALASAFFFRDFPPEARSSSHSPDTSQYGTPVRQGSSRVSSGNNSRERKPANVPPQDFTSAVKVETPAPQPVPNALYADPGNASFESLPDIDPAAAAYVLGGASAAPRTGAAAPMYGEGELFYPETGAPLPADDSAYETFSVPTTNGYVDYRNIPQASSSASSDIYELPPTNPAVYGYPLENVTSNAPSSYSGYESAASVTGGAASALERLDLDFDLPRSASPMHTPSAASGPSIARPPPLGRVDSSTSSSAASAHPPLPGEGVDMQTTDLDGILEWLASSTAAGGLPPPPPSSRSQPGRHDSASSSVATWPSAPPSSYGDSVIGAGYSAGAMYGGGGGGWTSYSESSDARGPPLSSSSAAGGSQAPSIQNANGGRTGGITWADNRDASDDDDSQAGEENSAGERVPRRRERNADLEMLRTATITYRDASLSASASDSPDVGGAGGGAWDSTRANSPHDPAASATGAARYARGHAFAAFIGDEFDRFGLGGEFDDDDWFRQIGVGSSGGAGLGDLRSGLAGLTSGGAEGDGVEDDGYEEDDEASVIGSRNPFDGNGFGDGYERSPDHMYELDGEGDDDEVGWDRDKTFGAGPLPPEPQLDPSSTRFDSTYDLALASDSQAAVATSSPDDPRDPDFRIEPDEPSPPAPQSIPSSDLRISTAETSHPNPVDAALEARSPASPSRLAAYLEQLEESKSLEEAAHDRGAGMWW